MLRFLLIVLMSVVAACVYGVVHDQITARVCVEYFTVGHAPVFDTDDPTLLGLGWGVRATWWMGLFLGVPLAVAARIGKRPQRSPGSLIRPIILLLMMMAICAAGSGILGYYLGKSKTTTLEPNLAEKVPETKHAKFIACYFAHSASYWVGFVGGWVNIAAVWASRRTIRVRRSLPSAP